MQKYFIVAVIALIGVACSFDKQKGSMSVINKKTIDQVIETLIENHGSDNSDRVKRGVTSTAALWQSSDGNEDEFVLFCTENFISDRVELDLVFDRLENNFKYLYGYMNRINLELSRQIHQDTGPLHNIDRMFGALSPGAHLTDDLFKNKIAFIITLNFPYFSLDEKNLYGGEWNNRQWGYARLGDYFTSRVPPSLLQEYSRVSNQTDIYISEYNIIAGNLLTEDGETLFPDGMKLLAHWNIRDEIKSNYGVSGGREKQEMLYKVMLRIISQDIPREVINNELVNWNPYENTVFKEGVEIESTPESAVRYEHLKNIFDALRNMDKYYPNADTYIKRTFNVSMEIPREEVESLFREYASSPLVARVGELISQREGRALRPFDLWYDGFKSRSTISEADLDKITKQRYPDVLSLENDIPRMLMDLEFDNETAEFIGNNIEVNAARGSGHAWGASMPGVPAHLRTRVVSDGLDYKGYNIAIHELGHNVEQVISVNMVDNYLINGVPNTAFTEALAFMFQDRDLPLLGVNSDDKLKHHLDNLDVFWNNFEMMGVSLVDMNLWEWMYQNPDATPMEIRDATIKIANEIWNEYFAPVFGEKDVPLLAIYSHMIAYPLYLSNYPYGRLIMFQLEEHLRDKNFADEVLRIFSTGTITPRHWMDRAVGKQISNRPIFNAVEEALEALSAL